MNISHEHCVPCESGKGKLTRKEIKELLKEVPGWRIKKERLVRELEFENFKEAFVFVEKVSTLAEEENHHPDITFGWGYATITLSTHAAKGLTKNDFVMAAKIG